MRRFVDRSGREWDVVLGRGSWGVHVALFAPVGHAAAVRQAELGVAALEEAMDRIDVADEADLQTLLDQSKDREE